MLIKGEKLLLLLFVIPSISSYPNRVTRPLEEAVMEPSSSIVYSAEMLSCRNSPSGSFFWSAYHFPAYCTVKCFVEVYTPPVVIFFFLILYFMS